MYEFIYQSNYFLNLIPSFITLLIFFIFSIIVSAFFENNKIKFFYQYNLAIIFISIIIIYTFLFNIFILFQLQEYFNKLYIFLISIKLIIIIINIDKIRLFRKNLSIPKFNLSEKYVIFVLLVFLVISFLPISDADSIANHQYFATYAFLNGLDNFNIDKYYEFSTFSNSEVILIFSPILKSDNFGALLNISIIIFFFFLNRKNKNSLFLFLISCPLIIFFISTQKLQLFFAFLFLMLFIFIHTDKIKSKFEISIFIFLLFFYISGKLSYILIGGPLYIYFILKEIKNLKFILLISIICFVFTIFPILLIKYYYFGNPLAPFFDSTFNNGRLSMESYALSVRSSEGWLLNPSNYSIYLKPFIPTSLGSMSNSLGIIFLLFLFNFTLLKKLKFFPILIITIVVLTGQLLPRYYFEAFLILSYFYEIKRYKIITLIAYFQSFGILILSLSFVFISYINENVLANKVNFMNRFSYSYFNALQYNKLKLDKNIYVVSQDRDSIFFEENIFSNRYLSNRNLINNNENKNLINFINENSIKYIVTNDLVDFPKCLGLKKIDEIYQKKSTRNFLLNNKNAKEIYNVYIINLNCKI